MRILLAGCFVLLACFGVVAQTRPSGDASLLRPTDIAYTDAMQFSRFLNQHNIAVKSIHRSKLESFFRGVNKAAFFETDKGSLEVIFFPDNGAEKVSAMERRTHNDEGERNYTYSFRGQPQPNPPADMFIAARPMYFITHGGWFIVTLNETTSNAVKSLF